MESTKEAKVLKVLLVDEDTQFTKKITSAQQMPSLDCVISNDISMGLSMMLEQEFDVVVLDFDVLMPFGNDIIEFLSIIQNLNHQRLVLTTKFQVEKNLTINMIKHGIDSFVFKSANIKSLYDVLKGANKSSKSLNTSFLN